MRDTAGKLVERLKENMAVGKGNMGNADLIRITDNNKVTDHHAIIPTVEISKTDLSELPKGERAVLDLIAVRLLCATAQPHSFEAATVTLDCADHIFTAKGKSVIQNGWKEIEGLYLAQIRQNADQEEAD